MKLFQSKSWKKTISMKYDSIWTKYAKEFGKLNCEAIGNTDNLTTPYSLFYVCTSPGVIVWIWLVISTSQLKIGGDNILKVIIFVLKEAFPSKLWPTWCSPLWGLSNFEAKSTRLSTSCGEEYHNFSRLQFSEI